jgi:hypothetical protein
MRLRLTLLVLGAAAIVTMAACQTVSPREKNEITRRHSDAAAYLAHPVTVGQLVLHADFMLPPEHRMLTELQAERELIYDRLKLTPSREPIHVYLFADEGAYREHISRKFPGFPERRAIFVETDVELSVYAHWGEAIAEDLRHEVAHGYLHAAAPNVPLWLDEGLAEYFEVGRGRRGLNRTHVEYLRGQLAVGGWRPDLARLERLASAGDMTQLDYAEAWLWVHFLLESPRGNPDVLTNFLAASGGEQPSATLSARIRGQIPQADLAVIEHLRSLAPAQAVN